MRQNYDIIIVGSGASGLHAAVCADPSLSVLVLSKEKLDLSNSALAQGGVAAVLDRQNDSFSLHFEDTMVAGGRKNDPVSLDVLVREGPENVLNLEKLGVDFDKTPEGALHLTLEGGHTRRRIAHHKDTTGFEIVTKLIERVRELKNVEIAEYADLLRVEKKDGGFLAGIFYDGMFRTVGCRFLVLATGGIGKIYKYSTNSKIATGDGFYFASKLGARIKNLSLIQFHPTAFAGGNEGERFLISESVRGEGAILLNGSGRRFMFDYDRRGELAPRDVVSKCIMKEQKATGSDRFYLDITAKEPEAVRNRFPAIYEKCLTYGIDITKDRIPVYPCHHYLMGGIDVDTCARTSVEGLYAVGECSHTGVHGNNRLASNSLLEALVFSRRAMKDIASQPDKGFPRHEDFAQRAGKKTDPSLRDEIRNIMQKSFFVNPDYREISRSLPRIREIVSGLSGGGYEETRETVETLSMANAAQIILEEIARNEPA